MTKAELKAKRRANRSAKRQEEHLAVVEQQKEQWREEELERLSRKNQYGKKDLTAYYGILNSERSERNSVYGVLT